MQPDLEFLKSLNVSHETIAKLLQYDALLHKWQKAVNLVSPSTLGDSWKRHILDSAQVLSLLPGRGILADLGCGGGFPGLVLAILNPALEVHLVESDEKKCQFMRTVSRETQTSVHIHTARIEAAYGLVEPDFISARALASLDKLLGYVMPWASANPELKCFFMKGERAEEEIELARQGYRFDVTSVQSVTEPQAKILHIRNISPL